jgi:hypothetical protein
LFKLIRIVRIDVLSLAGAGGAQLTSRQEEEVEEAGQRQAQAPNSDIPFGGGRLEVINAFQISDKLTDHQRTAIRNKHTTNQ